VAADNIVVGVLRTLLTVDSAQFEEGMRKGSSTAKKFGDDSTEVGKQLEKAFDVAKIAGGLAAFGTALVGVTKVMEGWLQSTSEQEDATARLSAALRAQGTFTPEVASKYDDLASAYERTTVFSDELLMGMEALLVQVGGVMPRDMKAALGAVTDLAAGLRIDLNTATMLVAKALEGNVGALHRYGINVDEARLKTEGATAVFDAIAQKMGGQAAAQAETFSGQMQRIANIVDNVKETLGGFIAGALKPLIDMFVALPEPIRTTVVAAGLVGAAAAATAVAIGGLTVATSTLLPMLGVALPAAATASTVALTALTASGGLIVGVLGALLSPIGLAVAAFAALTGGLLYLKDAITTDFKPAIAQATNGINEWREAATKAGEVKLPLDPNDLRAVAKAQDELTESAKASIKVNEQYAKELADFPLRFRALEKEFDAATRAVDLFYAVMGQDTALQNAKVHIAELVVPLKDLNATIPQTFQYLGNYMGLWHEVSVSVSASAGGMAAQTTSAFTSLTNGITDGIQHLWQGMSGGNGFAGLMNNLGDSIVKGFGNILSGGLASVINMGVSLAVEGVAKIGKLIGGLFQSEETKKVNKPRDQFFSQFGGGDGLASQLTQALIDIGDARSATHDRPRDRRRTGRGLIAGGHLLRRHHRQQRECRVHRIAVAAAVLRRRAHRGRGHAVHPRRHLLPLRRHHQLRGRHRPERHVDGLGHDGLGRDQDPGVSG
jgi:hypothetical protein